MSIDLPPNPAQRQPGVLLQPDPIYRLIGGTRLDHVVIRGPRAHAYIDGRYCCLRAKNVRLIAKENPNQK